MSASEALASRNRKSARILELVGGLLGLLALVVALSALARGGPNYPKSAEPLVAAGILSLLVLLCVAVGQKMRRAARRFDKLPPPRAVPSSPDEGTGDGAKMGKKG